MCLLLLTIFLTLGLFPHCSLLDTFPLMWKIMLWWFSMWNSTWLLSHFLVLLGLTDWLGEITMTRYKMDYAVAFSSAFSYPSFYYSDLLCFVIFQKLKVSLKFLTINCNLNRAANNVLEKNQVYLSIFSSSYQKMHVYFSEKLKYSL